MKDPVTIAAPRTRLCANDDYLWERVDELPEGRGLNEAPEVLQHGRRTFVTYSCSGSWQPSYKIGLLELKAGSDPLQATGWTEYPKPAFESTAATFGVGHNSFVKSPDATEDWLVYHAKMSRQTGWQRAVFTQPFTWRSDGLPDFGAPVAAGYSYPCLLGKPFAVLRERAIFGFQFRAIWRDGPTLAITSPIGRQMENYSSVKCPGIRSTYIGPARSWFWMTDVGPISS